MSQHRGTDDWHRGDVPGDPRAWLPGAGHEPGVPSGDQTTSRADVTGGATRYDQNAGGQWVGDHSGWAPEQHADWGQSGTPAQGSWDERSGGWYAQGPDQAYDTQYEQAQQYGREQYEPDQAYGHPYAQGQYEAHGQQYAQGQYDPTDATQLHGPWHGQQDQGWRPAGPQSPVLPRSGQSAGLPASAGHPMSSASAGHPASHASAGYPASHASAGYPMTQPSAGYPMSQSSAGYPMSQTSAPYPVSQASAGYPVSQASAYEPEAGAASDKAFPLKWLAAGAIVLALLTGTALFGLSEYNKSRESAPQAAPAMLTQRQPPPTWGSTYAWSQFVTQTSTVLVNDSRIVFVDGEGALNVLDADTGKVVFVSAGPRLSAGAKTLFAQVQGTPMVAVVDGQNLMLWPVTGGPNREPKIIALPTGAKVYPQGGGLMVLANREQWAVTGAATLAPVAMPGDHIPLGVAPDGMLVSAPQSGRWTFTPSDPGQAPRELKPEKLPDGASGEFHVARLSRGVIAGWADTPDAARKAVAFYDAGTGRLLAGATVGADLIKDMSLTVSPDGRLASAGPVLARLGDGRTEIMERWSAQMSDSKHLYGSRDGIKYAWSGEGAALPLDARMTIPWGTSAAGYAVVMEPADSGRFVLGALRPA